ncbi:MAG: hypothetical protein H7281_02735 [Bacteriovorax sp.]|nr:hypothetical protein [Bacteriovorax sp.]
MKDINFLMAVIWLVLCLAGLSALNWYKLLPGPVGKISVFWPHNIPLERDRSVYNLVLFAHPKCECTHASLIELEKLLIETKKKMKVVIFFYHPKGTEPGWTSGDSKDLSLKLKMTEVYDDRGGEIARRFGAMTSGQVMVYNPDGKLVFAGGITESRGHIGSNPGTRSIASVVTKGVPIISNQNTFGCLLFSEQEMKEYQR